MNEQDLYDLDDEALEAAFRAAKAEMGSEELDPAPVDSGEVEMIESDNLDNSQESDLDGTEEEVEVDTEAASEDAETDADGTDDVDSEQTEEVDAEAGTEVQPAQKYRVKANGKEYEFTESEIRAQFPKVFGQAMDYTRKMQQIKPWRQTIDAMEQAKLSHDDVSLMIDVLKGDKAAIAAVLKRTGVDTLELDTEDSKYVPKSYGRDESTLAIKDVVDEISQDQEYAVTSRIIDREWDEGSWREMSKDPTLIKALHIDVKSGVYNKVQPIAEKMKLYEGGRRSDLDYYKLAAQEYYKELAAQEAYARGVQEAKQEKVVQQERKVVEVKQKEVQRKTTEQAAAKRKAAAPTKPGPSKPQGVTDYLEDSDEAFEEWYSNLQKNL